METKRFKMIIYNSTMFRISRHTVDRIAGNIEVINRYNMDVRTPGLYPTVNDLGDWFEIIFNSSQDIIDKIVDYLECRYPSLSKDFKFSEML